MHSGLIKTALVGQSDHGAAGELGIQMHTEHCGAQQNDRHQAGREGQELFAKGYEIHRLLFSLFLPGLCSAVEPRVAQRLDGSCTANHNTGSEHAEHKVQQHAGKQRIAEGIDSACGRGAEGEEHKVQCLGKQAIRGAEGTHEHDGHDDDGHIAVNDGGQAAGKAALQCAIQRFAVFQFLFDALGGDDVGIHAHADGQNDTCDTGQGQGEAFKYREVAGHKGQRSRHLTGQRDAGQKARQTVQYRHEHHDEGKSNQAGQHHGAKAVFAQTGAYGGVAVHAQRKGQCTGVDLACHLDHGILRKGIGGRTCDDGLSVGDSGVDGSGAHVLVVQPDADAALVDGQLGGGIAKGLGALGGKLEGNVILGTAAVAHSAVLRRSAFDHGAVKDQLAVLAGSLAEGQVGSSADLLNGRLGVKIRLAGLPRELQNQAVGVVIHIQLVVGHVQRDQTVLNDQTGGIQLLVRGIVAIRGHKGDVDAALDIHTKADILCTLDVGGGHIAVFCRHAKKGGVDKHNDQQRGNDQLPCFAFCFHKSGTSKSGGCAAAAVFVVNRKFCRRFLSSQSSRRADLSVIKLPCQPCKEPRRGEYTNYFKP